MMRTLACALLVSLFAPLARAQQASDPLDQLSALSRSGQLPQLIQSANALLATDKLTPADQGIALIYLGSAYQQRGEFTKATAAYERALAALERDGHHPSEYATTLAALATTYGEIGQVDTAKHVLLRSIHLFEQANDHAGAAMIWNDLATIAADQHSRGEAHKFMTHSIAESQLAGDITPDELAALSTTGGRIAELDGNPRTAISDYQHALDLWKQTHDDQQQRTAWLYVLLGGAYLQAGDIANARETTTRGLDLLQTNAACETPRCLSAMLVYSKVLDAAGAHDEASKLRKEAQAALNSDRQRAQSTVSVAVLR